MKSPVDIYESRQGDFRAQTIAITALGLFFAILRFISRWKKGLTFGWDDYTIVLSVVSLIQYRILL